MGMGMDLGKWFDRLLQVVICVCTVGGLWLAYQQDHPPQPVQAAVGGPVYSGWLLLTLLGIAGLSFLISLYRAYRASHPQKIPTSIQLQFNAGNILPKALSTKNIWRWYSLLQVMVAVDPAGQHPRQEHKLRTIFLTLTLRRPSMATGASPTGVVRRTTRWASPQSLTP